MTIIKNPFKTITTDLKDQWKILKETHTPYGEIIYKCECIESKEHEKGDVETFKVFRFDKQTELE